MPDRGFITLRDRRFEWGVRTYVMAIVNVTPDSFSGDGRFDGQAAVAHALAQWEAGADIIDIGGESTRPGHVPVSVAEEIARAVPVVQAVRAALPGAPISIDTYKPEVARAAHAAGADLVNSVWGASDELLATAAERSMPIVATHNQASVEYGDRGVVDTVLRVLHDCAIRALAAGIAADAIVLDPGIGFGKTGEHNLAVLRALDRIVALGFPTLLGASRKATIGKLTGREPSQRVAGSLAVAAFAATSGIDLVRVHDVAATRDAVAVADAIARGWRPAGWTG